MKLRIFAVSILMFTLFAATNALAAYDVGDHIADFTLNDAYGSPVSLYDHEGLVIWVEFWTDT